MSVHQNVATTVAKRAFSIPEIVQMSGICRSRIYLEMKENRLRRRKVGRRSVVLAGDFDAWMDGLDG